MGDRDLRHWTKWTDGELIDQAAGASQHRALIDDAIVREAIRLNIIAPFRQQLTVQGDMLEALKGLEPFLDAIVCFASTMGEHEPNRLAEAARAAIAKAEARS